MAVLARVLGIGMAAALAFALLMMGDDGEGGARIGAGLAVFAVVAVGSFGWALLDGLGRTGTLAWFDARRADDPPKGPAPLRSLVVRWLLVSLLLVFLVQALRAAGSDTGWIETEPSTLLFMLVVGAGPAVVGAMLGSSVQGSGDRASRSSLTR